MRLRVNDTEGYNLTLDIEVDYENERISIVVGFWDKKKHKSSAWEYEGDEFHRALAKYRQLEKTYFGGK